MDPAGNVTGLVSDSGYCYGQFCDPEQAMAIDIGPGAWGSDADWVDQRHDGESRVDAIAGGQRADVL